MSETPKQADTPQPARQPLNELDGYDLVTSDSLVTPDGIAFEKRAQGTNTSASYAIVQEGEPVGSASLAFGLRR